MLFFLKLFISTFIVIFFEEMIGFFNFNSLSLIYFLRGFNDEIFLISSLIFIGTLENLDDLDFKSDEL